MILWRLHLAAARTIDMCMRRLVDDTKKLTWRGYSAFRPAVELCFSFPSAQNISTLTSRHHFTMDLGMKAKIRASIRSRHFSSHHSRVITAVDGFALYGRPHDEKAIGHDSYFIAETKNFTALGLLLRSPTVYLRISVATVGSTWHAHDVFAKNHLVTFIKF